MFFHLPPSPGPSFFGLASYLLRSLHHCMTPTMLQLETHIPLQSYPLTWLAAVTGFPRIAAIFSKLSGPEVTCEQDLTLLHWCCITCSLSMRGTLSRAKANTSLVLRRSSQGFFTGYSSQIARLLRLANLLSYERTPTLRPPELADW